MRRYPEIRITYQPDDDEDTAPWRAALVVADWNMAINHTLDEVPRRTIAYDYGATPADALARLHGCHAMRQINVRRPAPLPDGS